MEKSTPNTPNVTVDTFQVLHDLKNCVYSFKEAYETLSNNQEDKAEADEIFELAKTRFYELVQLIESVPERR